jgi:hypothetical protein
MEQRTALEHAGTVTRLAAAFTIALVAAWSLRELVVALRLGHGRPVAAPGPPQTEISLAEFRREALHRGTSGRFTADGQLRFYHYRLRGRAFDKEFREVAPPNEPFLEPLDLLANRAVVLWSQAESLARPGPSLSSAVMVPRYQEDQVAEGWFYDPRVQCLAGLRAGDGKHLGLAGRNGFAESAGAAGPLGELRLFGFVGGDHPGGSCLAVWVATAGVWIIDLVDRQVVLLAPGEVPWSNRVRIFPKRLWGTSEHSRDSATPPAAGTWSVAVGVEERAGTWALFAKGKNGRASVWRGGTTASRSGFYTDGTSLFVTQSGSDLTAGRDLPESEQWPWLHKRMTQPWHAWCTLHRIDDNGPVQVARYDWDVEGTPPPQPKPTVPQPSRGGFQVQFSRALLAGTTPPAPAPFSAWCRQLVPSPMSSAFGDTERYQPPLERFSRRFGWAYPLSAWQIPWAVLFAGSVLLHARRRGTRRRVTLAWGAATLAFGLAGVLAYLLTRPRVRRPCPATKTAPSMLLREPQPAE